MKPLPKRPQHQQQNALAEDIVELHPMDEVVENRNRKSVWVWSVAGLGFVFLSYFGVVLGKNYLPGSYPIIATDRLQIAKVAPTTFAETVPINGVIVPERTNFLDTVSGGSVVEVFVDDGELVEAGQPILQLLNTDLELQLIAREAQYTEQLSNLTRAQIQYDQSQLNYERQLSDSDLDIQLAEAALQIRLPIEKTGVPQAEIHRLEAELAHKRRTYDMLLAARDRDQTQSRQNLSQLKQSITRMGESLDLMRSTLDRLVIVAPMDGQLTSLSKQVGEVVAPGARIAEIHQSGRYKMTALIDEFYLGRVVSGQSASATINGQAVELNVSKVYSNVEDRRFRIDLTLSDSAMKGLKAGQSVRSRLSLSAPDDTLTIPVGDFLDHTGGQSVYLVNPQTQQADLREIRLGRRGVDEVEILSGLSEGDMIIIGGYESLSGSERVVLKGDL
ncbi:MAG: efflux RND transporter periplasmic adaptor subunit [Pseudomonadota bacterium]